MDQINNKFQIPKRLMFFSAHPDDEIGSAGGLILKVLKLGGAVRLVLCVDPAEPRLEHDGSKESETRLEEFNKVAEKIGAEHSYLGFAHYPNISYDQILPCVKEIRSFKPDAVAIIHEEDYHTEHQMIAKIVKRAVWHSGRSAFPECGVSHRVPELREVEGDRPMSEPNHLEDISGVIEEKKNLFALYGSQQARKDLAAAFTGLNNFRGVMYKRGSHAEAYKVTDHFYG